GAVARAGSRPGPVGREHLYESTLAEDARVGAALRATEPLDREHRQAREGRHSSRLLTMFRVPRPTRTIRLGAKPRTEPGR
ncbi:MAG: hypothetical protein M3335_00130, partial [Actinomycetota bacterium]|nr:hypothetical protein [Actinomycetota bacterium]